jgi:putative nucleotidyltransferase with HDIG domain
MVGTFLITNRATTATVSSFEGSLLRASLLSNDHLAVLEAERLAQLRAAIDTQGVAPALAAHDTGALERLIRPIQANATPAQLTIRVLDAKANELLTITPPGSAQRLEPLGDLGVVKAVLNGQTDPKGDKYVFPRLEPSGMLLYWVGPVRSDPQTVIGAVLVGESLLEIANSIQDSRASELCFYDPSGHVLLSSLDGAPSLSSSELTTLGDKPVRISRTIDRHPYEFLVGNWRLRSASIGYLAVALRADAVQASVGQIRVLMVLIFAVAALMTLLFGRLVAQRITRPVEHLVRSTAAVSAGNLSHRAPVETNDEIGSLAESFNAMAANLQHKTQELEESYFASMESLARAIDARDPYTFGHSTRVAAISLEIAQGLELNPEEQKTLRRAALLHDIGKIGVEDRILRKPGPLTDEDWEAMKQHPLIGYKMLSGLHFLKPSLVGILHHHERWDGKGFPAGLTGGAIPMYIRILTVADALDAMTSDRPYRAGLAFDEALAQIQKGAGTQFDPGAVDALMKRAPEVRILLMEKAASGEPRFDPEWLEKIA